MRQAGTIMTRQDAERFANYLLSLGISSKVEPAADAWAIWIHDENQLPRSKQELEQFQQRAAGPAVSGRRTSGSQGAAARRREETAGAEELRRHAAPNGPAHGAAVR